MAISSQPTSIPQFGEAYYRDIVFVGVAQIPTSLEIKGEGTLLTPRSGSSERAKYTAQLLDQTGAPIASVPIAWALQSAEPGVSIDQSGTLTVTSTSSRKVVVVATASSGKAKLTATKPVTIKPLGPTLLSVVGPAAVSASQTTQHVTFTARVFDQLGEEMPNPGKIAWSLPGPSTPGVTIDAAAGTVSVSSSAVAGAGFFVLAQLGSINGTQRVAVDAFAAVAFLGSDDTAVTVTVKSDRVYLQSMKNPASGWDWIRGAPSAVPLVSPVSGVAPAWKFVSAVTNETVGTKLTLTFRSSAPPLSLRSVWWARPGPGPVENWQEVDSTASSTTPVYSPATLSANVSLEAPSTMTLCLLRIVYAQCLHVEFVCKYPMYVCM